jgi:hypothetical protein
MMTEENCTVQPCTHNWEKVFREQAFRKQTGQGTAVKGISVPENPGEMQNSKTCFLIIYSSVTPDWEYGIVRMRTSRVVDKF